MRLTHGRLSSSPTDLANFLVCRYKTHLDWLAALGTLEKPTWSDPLTDVLRDRGIEHERRYVDSLRASGLCVVDLSGLDDGERGAIDAMRAGVDVIVQAPLSGDGWFGYADVLLRVEQPSAFGAWSYEVHDTKLSTETRGGTIVQLCVYTELLGAIQGRIPEYFRVVTPDGIEAYRFDDFAAFYRLIKQAFAADATTGGYPDAVEHCDICRWWDVCNSRRRQDDHLSFVAGLGRVQQTELQGRDIGTLARLAGIAVPLEFKPNRGSQETYVRLREQARVQMEARDAHRPVYELLPLDRSAPGADLTNVGLARLPEPSPGDLFLDLEGDPFAREGGREYLFGLGRVADDGGFSYSAYWAFDDEAEREAFEAVVDDITATLAADPRAHVYHYAPYEPAAFKRLMGRHASREAEIDALLRGGRFVDLYGVVRRAIRAGVESYSIKWMEPFYGFARDVELARAGDQRRVVEIGLETNDMSAITPVVRQAVEGYNRDDCRSTLELRNWLEHVRTIAIAGGVDIARPEMAPGAPSEALSERQAQVRALRAQLLQDVPADAGARTEEQQARYLLGYALDWHHREEKSAWWEYFRLIELSDEALLDEPAAVAGLEFVDEVGTVKRSVIARYRYPLQEMEIRAGGKLRLKDEKEWGEVEAVDRKAGTIDVLVGPSKRLWRPSAAFAHTHVSSKVLEDALLELGRETTERLGESAAHDLLLRRAPRLRQGAFVPREGEEVTDFAVRISSELDHTLLALQGPPGSGKTFTGARMICELVRRGQRVGVVATGHKVIRNLLDAVVEEAARTATPIKIAQKGEGGRRASPNVGPIIEVLDNEAAHVALSSGTADVLGATAWLWARPEFAGAVDVLFVDEAGQMSLANVLAVSRAARSVVLLGDPRQLEQPQKGSHPDGVDVSALQHMLGKEQTMPEGRGLFLPVTWRLAPAVCAFTSEVFYESKLRARDGLEQQRLAGDSRYAGAGLWIELVEHEGCRNASDQEAETVAAIVGRLLAPGSTWIDQTGVAHQMTAADILVVAPYNAHVSRLAERLPAIAVGTVDKFQGQEAPVVIYSMATSRPGDAPRGMEFLYSLNRLNVATSRAKCACILVASPHLFAPDCRTPRQMHLANALCRYREIATRLG